MVLKQEKDILKQKKDILKYIFLYPSGGKREHVNKVRQPVKVEPKRYLISTASRASCADIFGS